MGKQPCEVFQAPTFQHGNVNFHMQGVGPIDKISMANCSYHEMSVSPLKKCLLFISI